MSVIVSRLWEDLAEDRKAIFRRQAEIIKAEHAAKYPHYKYSPKSKKGEVKRKAKKMDAQENASCVEAAARLKSGKEEDELFSGQRRIEDELDGAAKMYRRSSSCPVPATMFTTTNVSAPQYLVPPRPYHPHHARTVSAGSSSLALKIPTLPSVLLPREQTHSPTHFEPLVPNGPVFTNPFASQASSSQQSSQSPFATTPTYSTAPTYNNEYEPAAPPPASATSSNSLSSWSQIDMIRTGSHSPAASSLINTPQSTTHELAFPSSSSSNGAACPSTQPEMDQMMQFNWNQTAAIPLHHSHSHSASLPQSLPHHSNSHLDHSHPLTLFPDYQPAYPTCPSTASSSSPNAATQQQQQQPSYIPDFMNSQNIPMTYARRESLRKSLTWLRRGSIAGDLFMGPAAAGVLAGSVHHGVNAACSSAEMDMAYHNATFGGYNTSFGMMNGMQMMNGGGMASRRGSTMAGDLFAGVDYTSFGQH